MPSSSTLANPEVVYAAPGIYSVTFTATNTAGSGTTTQTNLINVGTAATAGFTSTNNANLYSFNNASAGGTSYSWDFGDTGTSTANNPTHSYSMDGTYTVVLTAINACGTNTSTQTVTVVTPPVANFTATGGFGCSPLTVVFNNTSSSNANSFAWQFPGGNPAFSTATNPTVVYSSPGVYSVNLTATNNAGSSNVTQTNFVTVETIPSPNFVASNNGASFNFSNASAGATAYSWNFGDSQTSTLENPNHYYLADGTYTVVLTASNACGTATSTQTVTVTTPPVANFTATGNNGCAPISVTFNNTSSSNATGFSWQFPAGDPANSTDSNPVVNYTTPGIYAVILTASNAAGNSTVTQTDFVVAGGVPTAIFLTAVNGAELTLNNTSSGATSYLWDFGDGLTSTLEAPTHTYLADGSYTVVLTSSNNCGTATSTQTVLVETAPVANFAVGATAGCTPFTVIFDNQSSANATSYEWTFQGGIPAISTDENPSVVYSNPGIYSATLMATNAAGSSTVVKTNLIQVNTTPVTAFTVQTGGLSAEFTNGSYNAQSFFWDFGDGGTSTDVNPVHDYGAPGTYTVVLKAINDCGTAEFTLPVTIVGSAPIPAFSAGDQTKGCAPLSVQFTDESVGQPNAWLWTFPNGTPSTATVQNPVVVYATPGIYDVTLQVSNSFGTNTLVQPSVIEVLPTPLALFESSIAGATVTFSNLSQNATSYQWNFGDGSPVSSLQNPNHVYAQTGTYTVSLTALNDCGSALYQITVAVTVVGTDELADWAQEVRLFPNPNNGKFTLDIKGLPKEELQFEMFNSIGQLIKRDVHAFNTGKMSRLFDYGHLPVGNYLLRVSDYSSSFVIHVAITK
jgi:PKD repeat protein